LRFAAPGKAILVGEHAVVHGRTAIGVPVPAVRVLVEVDPGGRWLWLPSPGHDPPATDPGEVLGDLVLALSDALEAEGIDAIPPVGLVVRGGVTTGGLGTSAALCVALSRAMIDGAQAQVSDEVLARVANTGEALFHGNPSGLDAAVAAYGRPVVYRRGDMPRPVELGGPVHLVVAASQARSSTRRAVRDVADLLAREPASANALLDRIEEATQGALRALASGEQAPLAASMDLAQEALTSLHLDHPATDALRALAMERGALSAKITGAGQGGSILALAPSEAAAQALAAVLSAQPECMGAWTSSLLP
jgi:mevalonate kinase